LLVLIAAGLWKAEHHDRVGVEEQSCSLNGGWEAERNRARDEGWGVATVSKDIVSRIYSLQLHATSKSPSPPNSTSIYEPKNE
jgi:hypothetical protein